MQWMRDKPYGPTESWGDRKQGQELGRGQDQHWGTREILGVSGDDGVEAGLHGAGDVHIVLEVGTGRGGCHFEGRPVDGYDSQRPRQFVTAMWGACQVRLLADDVEQGGKRGGGNSGVDPSVLVSVPDRIGFGSPGFSSEEGIQYDVQIEQDGHWPNFSIRCSSTQRSTVSSSGGGRSVLSKPYALISAADSPRSLAGTAAAAASAVSRDSRIFRASVIRNVIGQVLTRFSTSVNSVASAVLMGSAPSDTSRIAVSSNCHIRLASKEEFTKTILGPQDKVGESRASPRLVRELPS